MSDQIRTEIVKCNMTEITGCMEWSQPEQREMAVIKFKFEEHGTARCFWHKTRVFSNREDIRDKAWTGVKEIDGAMAAGGLLVDAIASSESAVERLGLVDIVQAGGLERVLTSVKGVILVHRSAETVDPRTDRPYISHYVHRVLPWDESVEGVSEPDPEDFVGMRGDIAQFCQTKEWLIIRREVLKLFGTKCQCCGATNNNAVITVDHIIPRSRKPALALSPVNLQVLCRECNVGKGSDDETDYRTDEQIALARQLHMMMTSND